MSCSVPLFCLLCFVAAPPKAECLEADFVGTWELQSIEVKGGNGEWTAARMPEDDQRPVGVLMYDDKGNMAVQITTEPRHVETPEDNPEVIHGYVAYYGKYNVDAKAGTITHRRQNHINPSIGKLDVVRYFQFSGDILTLSPAPQKTMRLKWKRIR